MLTVIRLIWGKSIKTNKEKIKTQLNDLCQYARRVAASEMDNTDPSGFDKIDAAKVQQTIDKINEALKNKPVATNYQRLKLKADKRLTTKKRHRKKKEKML
jgi:hypothetical protein